MSLLIVDVETQPLDTEWTRELEPVLATFPAFDEAKVKLGNAKSPEAIHSAKVAAKERWERDRAEHMESHVKAVQDWQDAKTLNPLLSKVLAIGLYGPHPSREVRTFMSGCEAENLLAFWGSAKHHTLAGWNIYRFDLPFLIERTRILELPLPEAFSAVPLWKSSNVIDLMQHWNGGGDMRKLDHVAGACGFPRKINLGMTTRPDGITRPALPHEVSDQLLREYLVRDVEIEAAIAHRLFPDRVLRPWDPEPSLSSIID